MPILVSCDHCGRDYKLKSKLAGTRFRCRDCTNVLRVPYPEKVEEDDETDDETPSIDDLSWAPVPPAGGVLGLPPASKSASTSPRVASPERNRKWKYKKRVKFPWIKLIGVVVGLILAALLMKLGFDYSKQWSHQDENQGSNTETDEPQSSSTQVVETITGWRDFQLPDQPITIQMPDDPEPIPEQLGTMIPKGAELNDETDPEGIFKILYIDVIVIPGVPLDVIKQFQETKTGMLNSIPEGRLTSESRIEITDQGGKHPSRMGVEVRRSHQRETTKSLLSDLHGGT